MPITGAHLMLNTPDAEALRAQLRDVFGFDHVDAGGGWLIFALPATELGVHPSDGTTHELSFHCDDIHATMAELEAKGVEFLNAPQDAGFGIVARMRLAGGVEVDLYQPAHPKAHG
jgi:catechol 2,3-dioxygenase-like lactoylglutathione lyase family enzyme